jgi:hypothetical protein
LFCTKKYQEHFKSDNQWISLQQKIQKNGKEEEALFVGNIQQMYLHRLRKYDEPVFIIKCYWYEVVGTGANRLQQVRYSAEWEKDPYQFLDVCIPENLVCFPCEPWDFDFSNPSQYKDPEKLFNVIRF